MWIYFVILGFCFILSEVPYLFLLLGLGRFWKRLLAVSSLPTLIEISVAFRNLHAILQGRAEGSKIGALNYT